MTQNLAKPLDQPENKHLHNGKNINQPVQHVYYHQYLVNINGDQYNKTNTMY